MKSGHYSLLGHWHLAGVGLGVMPSMSPASPAYSGTAGLPRKDESVIWCTTSARRALGTAILWAWLWQRRDCGWCVVAWINGQGSIPVITGPCMTSAPVANITSLEDIQSSCCRSRTVLRAQRSLSVPFPSIHAENALITCMVQSSRESGGWPREKTWDTEEVWAGSVFRSQRNPLSINELKAMFSSPFLMLLIKISIFSMFTVWVVSADVFCYFAVIGMFLNDFIFVCVISGTIPRNLKVLKTQKSSYSLRHYSFHLKRQYRQVLCVL